MERCVPLPDTAICFMGDLCGDPVRDDGLMSPHKTITVAGEWRHASVASALISHFLEQNSFCLSGLKGPF